MAEITNAMIDAKLVIFTTDRNKLRDLGQEIALMVLNHAAPEDAGPNAQGTGDCTRAAKLASEMPKSWATQLTSFFIAVSPIRINGSKVAYDDAYKALKITPDMSAEDKAAVREERLKWWRLEEAAIHPFYEFDEPDSKVKILDLAGIMKWLEAQASSLEKKADDGKVAASEIETAKAVAARLRAIKVMHVEAANTNVNDVNDKAPDAPKIDVPAEELPALKAVNG
jgi:hypothetical protein